MAQKLVSSFFRPAAVSALEQGVRGMIKTPSEIAQLTADDVERQIAEGHPCLPDQQKPDPEWIARRCQNGVHSAVLTAKRMTAAGEVLPMFFENFLVGLARALEARGLHRLPDPEPAADPEPKGKRGKKAVGKRHNGTADTINPALEIKIEIDPSIPKQKPPDPNRTFIVHFYDRYLKPVVERERAKQSNAKTATPLEVATR